MQIEVNKDAVESVYKKTKRNLEIVRKRIQRPLTLAEKVLFGHLADPQQQDLTAGESFLDLYPDRVAMQDATAQMALLQFMNSGKNETAVPSTVHCDHLIQAYKGAGPDMKTAMDSNREVYDFLQSCSQRYGIGFWKPGAGIIHQVVLENYAFPGAMMIGTDSHTPNAGGLGMIACGVGGADAVDVMAGFPWEVKNPKMVGVKLTGVPSGWTAPKDVILKVCEILTTKGGTNRIIEYFGPGTSAISCTGKATITNMGAELGATTSIFPYDSRMVDYLKATKRGGVVEVAAEYRDLLEADPEVAKKPENFFDQVIEIDLSTLEPHVVGPHSPDVARPVSKLGAEAKEKGYPQYLTNALIGSCTNSSYEDMERASDVARQAASHGVKAKIPFMVTPGSDQIFETVKRDGQMEAFEKIGGMVLANACGPCIGQWKRDDISKGEKNSIITSYNRNFPRRNDGNPETYAFISSPEIVVAYALTGDLNFNPLNDEIVGEDGKSFRLDPPKKADDVPRRGFVEAKGGYVAPAEDRSKVDVVVSPESERLQLLTPFEKWNGKDFTELPLLLKAKGKCTTDHISPAGPWLRFRGHLDNISDNMFIGAENAFTGEFGTTRNLLTDTAGQNIAGVARAYKAKGLKWVVVGDENYGEGSSREHAAMTPRHLGAAAIVARSFARIAETNLKKQGVLPLTFLHPSDYSKVREKDRISILGLAKLAPRSHLKVVLHHEDGSQDSIEAKHSLNEDQVKWFRAGSALNMLAKK